MFCTFVFVLNRINKEQLFDGIFLLSFLFKEIQHFWYWIWISFHNSFNYYDLLLHCWWIKFLKTDIANSIIFLIAAFAQYHMCGYFVRDQWPVILNCTGNFEILKWKKWRLFKFCSPSSILCFELALDIFFRFGEKFSWKIYSIFISPKILNNFFFINI